MLIVLLIIPILSLFTILIYKEQENIKLYMQQIKSIALFSTIFNLIISLIIFLSFDFSSNQYQFVEQIHNFSNFCLYIGVDGISVYFVLLTTIIIPVSLLAN